MAAGQCNYHGCKNTFKDQMMFKYPVNDWARLNLWLLHSGNMALNSREFHNKYICKNHFPPAMITSDTLGRVSLARGAVPDHYLDKTGTPKILELSYKGNKLTYKGNNLTYKDQDRRKVLVMKKPGKVYIKKRKITKTYKNKASKGNGTQRGNAFDTEIARQDNDSYNKVKKEKEQDNVYSSANVNTETQTNDIPEDNTNITVKKEFYEDPEYTINSTNSEEFNPAIKIEAPTTDWDIKIEPPHMIDIKIENECSDSNNPLELSDPSDSNLNCNSETYNVENLNVNIKEEPMEINVLHSEVVFKSDFIHETSTQETEELKYKLHTNKRKMDTPTPAENIPLTEEVLIKEEYPVDTSMTNEQTNVAADEVVNIKTEPIECDLEVECNDPLVECDGPEVECTSNTTSNVVELTDDVEDHNKLHMVPTDEQASSVGTLLKPQPVGKPRKGLWFCGPCNLKFYLNSDLQLHKSEQHGAPLPSPTTRRKPPEDSYKYSPSTYEIAPIFCPTCNAKFNYMCGLRKHMSEAHNKNAKTFQCDVCAERFKHDFSLAAHMREHNGTNFHCDKCDRQCKTKRGLAMHLNSHTKERVFTCPKCEQAFTERWHLLNHLIKHTPNEKFHCGTCDRSFESSTDFKAHSSIHLSFFPCKVCAVKFDVEADLDAHMREHTKVFECTFCLEQFQDVGELQKHSVTHQNLLEKVQDASYACSHCGKRFLYRSMMLTHERIHRADRPYSCERCPQRFKTSSARNEHCRGHMKSYKCTDCGKCFARTQTLELHRRIHTGEKPYSCHLCDKAFAQRFSLNHHLHKSHGHLQARRSKKPKDQKTKRKAAKRQQ